MDRADVDTLMDGEWVIVDYHGWWRTSFSAVPWSYPSQSEQTGGDPCSPTPHLRYVKPPYYHDSLFANRVFGSFASSRSHNVCGQVESLGLPNVEDDRLNSDLIGVEVAEQAIKAYEIDVGFYRGADQRGYSSLDPSPDRTCLGEKVDGNEILASRQRWQGLMRDLTGELATSCPSSSVGAKVSGKSSSMTIISTTPSLSPSSSTNFSPLSSADFTGSQWSAKSSHIPSPTSKSLHSNVNPESTLSALANPFTSSSGLSKNRIHCPNPRRASTCSPSPTFTIFTTPAANSNAESQSPSLVSLEKDSEGFYKGSSTPYPRGSTNSSHRPSSTLLPSFLADPLRQRKSSSTRTIVDLLRSSSNQEMRSKCKSVGHSPRSSASCSPSASSSTFNNLDLDFFKPRRSVSEDGGDSQSSSTSHSTIEFEEDDDGWIRPGVSEVETTTNKTRRTRKLCLALARHRSDSNSSKDGCSESKRDGTSPPSDKSSSNGQIKFPILKDDGAGTSNNDGWIEGPSQLPPKPCPKPSSWVAGTSQRPNKKSLATTPTPALAPLAPPTSSAHFPTTALPYPIPPTMYFPAITYPGFPHPPYAAAAAAAYMQAQMQLHSQMQFQMQLQVQSQGGGHLARAGEWAPLPPPPLPPPLYPAHFMPVQAMAAPGFLPAVGLRYGGRAYPESGNITGTSGMKHTLR